MATERPIDSAFGQAAGEYDRIRPGYPDDLIDAVLQHAPAAVTAGGPAGSAIEVGAGTGKATRAFAARGIAVTAIEPDAAMAAVLRARSGERAGVSVRVVRFEDAGPGDFPLLFSAQAWHWTDPAVRWQRAAALIRAGGTIALFWNFDRIADRRLQSAVTRVHERHTPQINWDTDPIDEASIGVTWPADELADRPEFTAPIARVFRWQRVLSRSDYLAYLGTHSAYLRLTAADRDSLFAALAETLPPVLPLAEDTVLHLATRTG